MNLRRSEYLLVLTKYLAIDKTCLRKSLVRYGYGAGSKHPAVRSSLYRTPLVSSRSSEGNTGGFHCLDRFLFKNRVMKFFEFYKLLYFKEEA